MANLRKIDKQAKSLKTNFGKGNELQAASQDFTFFHLPYDIIEYPKIFYKVSFTRQIKKNGNYSAYDKFFFEFEPGVNQFDETTVLFSKKLKQTIKRKSVALIKSNFK